MKKKVYLFCSQGMSTSMLAQQMQNIANQHELPMEVAAYSHGQLNQIIEEKKPDVIMLGPQIKYLYEETVKTFGSYGAPILMISPQDYGVMDAEKVLKQAIMALKKRKAK